MALPKISFKDSTSPLKMFGGVQKDIIFNVTPRAVGKCKVRLFIEAGTCRFADGTSEMTLEVEATSIAQKLECLFPAKITCSQALIYTFWLNGEATNSEGKKMDCAVTTEVDCSLPPPADVGPAAPETPTNTDEIS